MSDWKKNSKQPPKSASAVVYRGRHLKQTVYTTRSKMQLYYCKLNLMTMSTLSFSAHIESLGDAVPVFDSSRGRHKFLLLLLFTCAQILKPVAVLKG